ncbi:MAG TPA: 4Fe-4S dicluster domain-containing protein [Geobacteraceae bacterium]
MKKLTSARICQYIFLALFLGLFVMTDYRGRDDLPVAVNSFFRADPLVAVGTLLAAKGWNWLVVPGLLVLVASALLGRFFCGWLCPLGTLLDLITPRIAKRGALPLLSGTLKYWLLALLLATALLNLNLVGLLDPLAILLRGLTFSLYPFVGDSVRQGWVGLYRLLGEHRDVLSPAYGVLRDHLLPFRETVYPLAFTSLFILTGIFFLERYETRNWCRNLCPLGTLLGLVSRFSLVRRLPLRLCADCDQCRDVCPTSFTSELLQQEECILCLECQRHCPHNRVVFRVGSALQSATGTDYSRGRRALLGGLLCGVVLARLSRFRDPAVQARLLRPPGVLDEGEFLTRCVRCGECFKVCLTSALYPAVGQAGAVGLYTPVVLPRLGYCEYNCTLCGQVCPTGAIPRLARPEKQRQVLGKAVFDRNHCLPYARLVPCNVCEEHCPIPTKAIRTKPVSELDPAGRPVTLDRPYVVPELCNGCGICEHVCPLEGKPGIEVVAAKDRTPLSPVELAEAQTKALATPSAEIPY